MLQGGTHVTASYGDSNIVYVYEDIFTVVGFNHNEHARSVCKDVR